VAEVRFVLHGATAYEAFAQALGQEPATGR
jgi:hypothetical protein